MSDIVEAAPKKTAFLDTFAARLLALAVAFGVGYLLFLSHLHYRGESGGMLAGVDKASYDACVGQRMAAFEKVAEGANYTEEQRAAAIRAARTSANALCAEMARPDSDAAMGSAVRR